MLWIQDYIQSAVENIAFNVECDVHYHYLKKIVAILFKHWQIYSLTQWIRTQRERVLDRFYYDFLPAWDRTAEKSTSG